MLVNFRIIENYAVQFKGSHLDLHNNFNLKSINQKDSEVEIWFEKTTGNWVPEKDPKTIVFKCKNVTFQFIKEGEKNINQNDSRTLSELTFFSADFREVNDSLVPKGLPETNDDIIFFFENGRIVRINCEEIELIVFGLI